MKFLLGTKQNMTQYFLDDGSAHPVTIISAGPVVVTDVKTKERDGYNAVQIGYGVKKEKKVGKAEKGRMTDIGFFKVLKEFRPKEKDSVVEMKKGDKIEVSTFAVGDKIEVSSISKGKGFQGVVKRHGFHGGPRTHGQKHSEREPGSIGGGLRTRVPKGMRMAGRTGSDRVTVKNLKVMAIDTENNVILIKGAIPGRRGTLVELKG